MQVTYSSDYFQELHDLALQLIKSGHAFVCHQTAEEISEYRSALPHSLSHSLTYDSQATNPVHDGLQL